MNPSAFSSLVPPAALPPYAQQPPHASTSAASVSAPAAGTTDGKNRRLPKEALAILHNFWNTVSDKPNNEQKEDLHRQLSTFPGTEWYTRDHIARYFAQRRVTETARRKKNSALSQAQRQFWPSLDNTKIKSLRKLYEEKRNPNKKVIALWAQSLNAEIAHIEAWLAYQSDEDDDDNMDTDDARERTHLPTPEATASPEPSFVKMGNSPTIPPVQSPPPFVTIPPFAVQPSPTNRYFSPTGHPYPPSVYYSKMQPPPYIYQVPQPTQSQLPSPVSPVAPVPPSPLKAAPWSPELKPALVSPVETTTPAPQAPRLSTPTSAPVSKAASPAPSAPVASPQEVARRRLKTIALNVRQRMEVDDMSSLSEYGAKAAVLEREGEDFLHKVRSGRFASLGLTADMVPSRADIEAQLRRAAAR